LFALTTIGHIYQAWRLKKTFCWVLIMGGIWEVIAMGTRIIEIINSSNKSLNQTSFVFILLAPLWINAFCYIIVGRMIHFYMPDHQVAGIKGERVAMIFVLADISSFIVQLGGALIATGTGNNVSYNQTMTGLHVYTAGICYQEAVIIAVIVLLILFQLRLKHQSALGDKQSAYRLLIVLYSALTLITWRIAYRIVEYSSGTKTPLRNQISDNEWYLYVFDTGPMFLALVVFHLYHPGRVLVGENSEFPKLTKEEKRQKKEDKMLAKKEKRRLKAEKKLSAVSSLPLQDV
ncbi:hypothetical protein BZG36_05540, partial [Bifiguratus adelaidae]